MSTDTPYQQKSDSFDVSADLLITISEATLLSTFHNLFILSTQHCIEFEMFTPNCYLVPIHERSQDKLDGGLLQIC